MTDERCLCSDCWPEGYPAGEPRVSHDRWQAANGTTYRAQSARDAERTGYGDRKYWDYLESSAIELRDYFLSRGETERAESMLTRSLSESLMGNEGP